MKYLLDTDTLSVAARDGSAQLKARLGAVPARDVVLSAIAVGEIEFGLARNALPDRILSRIATLRAGFRVLAVDEPVAGAYGRLRQELQRRGTPIGPNDMWIAAHALVAGLTLVSGNEREFTRVPGLKVENWLR